MPESLHQFFDSYRDAWNSLYGEAIAAHYAIPTHILDGDGYAEYPSQEDLIDKFSANCAAFAALGYAGSRYSESSCIKSGEMGASVDLAWEVDMAEGVRAFGTTYTCLELNGQWQIVCAIAYASV